MPELYKEDQYYMFRGKPLMREKNAICYGDMTDKYVLFLLILSEKTVAGEGGKEAKIPDNIIVQLLSTDTSKPIYERIVKQVEKNSLYDAMDIGVNWLESMN